MRYPINIKSVPAILLLTVLCACNGIAPDEQSGEMPGEKAEAPAERFGYPVEYMREKNPCYAMEASYPFLGRPVLDQTLRILVDDIYHNAEADFQAICRDDAQNSGKQQFMMDYELFSTPHVVAVALHNWSYTGGAHGSDGVYTVNMRLTSGNELAYADIFTSTYGLWEFLSDYVYDALRPELGQIWQDMPNFTEGLEPVENSFSHFAVTPQGLRLYFPSYQIAPYSAGPQQCDVPLDALVKFIPKPEIWQ